jgi:hypothetical protein
MQEWMYLCSVPKRHESDRDNVANAQQPGVAKQSCRADFDPRLIRATWGVTRCYSAGNGQRNVSAGETASAPYRACQSRR